MSNAKEQATSQKLSSAQILDLTNNEDLDGDEDDSFGEQVVTEARGSMEKAVARSAADDNCKPGAVRIKGVDGGGLSSELLVEDDKESSQFLTNTAISSPQLPVASAWIAPDPETAALSNKPVAPNDPEIAIAIDETSTLATKRRMKVYFGLAVLGLVIAVAAIAVLVVVITMNKKSASEEEAIQMDLANWTFEELLDVLSRDAKAIDMSDKAVFGFRVRGSPSNLAANWVYTRYQNELNLYQEQEKVIIVESFALITILNVAYNNSWNLTSFYVPPTPSSPHYCEWPIDPPLCNAPNRRIQRLELANRNMNQRIPPHVALLGDLKSVNFSNTRFLGGLIKSFGRLPNLQVLDISNNQLTGPLLTDYGPLLTNLQVFRAENNALTGSIPRSYRSWTKLETLTLAGNLLNGAVPEAICDNLLARTSTSTESYVLEVDCTEVSCSCCTNCI